MSESKDQQPDLSLQVILVDESDRQTGTCEKLEAHYKALLHRAYSIFIFNDKQEMLLQKRAENKYHSPGLWTNACCSHPSPGERTLDSAQIRLQMEMGFSCNLTIADHLLYKHDFENGLTEHEYDHIIIGYYSEEVRPNTAETSAYKWLTLDDIRQAIIDHPDEFTYWFKMALPKVQHYLDRKKQSNQSLS